MKKITKYTAIADFEILDTLFIIGDEIYLTDVFNDMRIPYLDLKHRKAFSGDKKYLGLCSEEDLNMDFLA